MLLDSQILLPLLLNWFRMDFLSFGLKGNRVKIPNSPAAVKLRSTFRYRQLPLEVIPLKGGHREGIGN